jgi:crossover junction endodeoxyribonuclease RuvC
MRVIGFDPGLATTGYGIIAEEEDSTIRSIEFGVISTPAKLSEGERLTILYKKIKEIICKHVPDCGAVEKIYFQQNVTNALSVGQARGIILLAMAELNLPVGEYSPLEVKQAVTGYGRAEKSQIQRMVMTLLQLSNIPKPDDAADALSVAICHINSHRLLSKI